MSNELISLKFTLPLCKMFPKSSAEGVWNSSGAAQFFTILHSTMSPVLLQTNFDPKIRALLPDIFQPEAKVTAIHLLFNFYKFCQSASNNYPFIFRYINFYAWIPSWVFVCFIYAFVKYVHARLVCLVAVFKGPLELGFNLTTPHGCWSM